ncbi:fasciclin domain-containing protein [Dietzia sp. B32]|uniref:fasciclin domain-containing protein n=1 Tax=Dietzia sp. B32 TaxID=2915130 RepID=UPI0021AD57FC|nr:fasciclin domain-containing protein [Dietzia sp. B32]UVE93880.1 fasciclin domain-containing protein [Dietzia sp. B32]
MRSRPQRGAVVVVGEGGVLDVDDERVRTLIGGAHRCSCFFVDGCTRWPAASVPSRVSTTPGTLASKGILPSRGPGDISPSRHGATTIRPRGFTYPLRSADTTEETGAAAEGDIVDTANAAGDFTTLTQAIEAAGLTETLKGPGPFTVFAPTDEAFEALPEGTLDELLADPTGDLAQILQYHVIEGEVPAADVLEMDGQTVATLQGGELTVEVEGENVALVDGNGTRVNVVQTDVDATNGVIHVLDGVLMPPA